MKYVISQGIINKCNLFLTTRRNFIHSNCVFVTSVQLLSKSTHFVITYVIVLCVIKSQVLIITYVTMKQMDLNCNRKCDCNLWLLCVSIKKLMKVNTCYQLLLNSIDGQTPNHFCNYFNVFFQLYIDDYTTCCIIAIDDQSL